MIDLSITGERYYTGYSGMPYIYEGAEYKIKNSKALEEVILKDAFLVNGVKDYICSIKGYIIGKGNGHIPEIIIKWNMPNHSDCGNEESIYLTHEAVTIDDAIKMLSKIFIKCNATLDNEALSTELCKCTAVIQHNLDNIAQVNRLTNMINELIQRGNADFNQLCCL